MALVGDVDDARAQIARGRFDVGILDIDLRGDKAFGLADELQRQGIPFVFATGYGPEIIPARFADVARWEKPFDPDAVARHVLQFWHRYVCVRRKLDGRRPTVYDCQTLVLRFGSQRPGSG
jgi:DNA-binding NtrC family response regulator